MSAPTNGTTVRPPTTARDAFGFYLACGLTALPAEPNSKRCALGEKGVYRREVRPADLDRFFPRGTDRGIGICNGAVSGGLLDVDLDSALAVRLADVFMPPTGWRFARRGAADSAHRLYRSDPTFPHAERKYHDPVSGGLLFELRGDGHWSIVPPSIHENGQPIEWQSLDDHGPPRLPLAELEKAAGRLAAACLLVRHYPPESARHHPTLALAGGLYRCRISQDEAERFITTVGQAAGDLKTADRAREVRSTYEKAQRGEGEEVTGWPTLAKLLGRHGDVVVQQVREWLGKPASPTSAWGGATSSATPGKATRYRPLPPFVPFPAGSLPVGAREYAVAAAENIGCDLSLVALPVLAALAGAIGNSRAVTLRSGWSEPAAVWAVTVADSGGHKSPAYSAAIDPLHEHQMDLIDLHRLQVEEFNKLVAEWSAKKKEERGPKPEEPAEPPCLLLGDATIECVGERLRDNPRGVLVAVDELDGWFQSFTRYKGKGGGSDRAQWLQLHRAGKFQVDRLTRERGRLDVRRALACVVGTVQPRVLAKVFDPEAMQAGLAARFLMAMPPRQKRVWTDAEVPSEVAGRYSDLLKALLALPLDDAGKRKPHFLGLSGPAKRAWVRFYNEFGEEQHAAHGEQAAALAKLEAYGARLALIHHVVTHAALEAHDKRPIGEASVEAAVTLTRWFADEATRIYMTLRESEEEADTRRLVDWLRGRGGRATARDLHRSNSGRWPSADEAKAALDALATLGLGAWVEDGREGKGRRSRWFVLSHPTPDVSDVSDDEEGEKDDGPPDDLPDENPPGDGTSACGEAANPFRGKAHGGDLGRGESKTSETSGVGQDITAEQGADLDAEKRRAAAGKTLGGDDEDSASDTSDMRRRLVNSPETLSAILTAIEETGLVAVDLETTGLDPRRHKVRLLSLGVDTIDGGTFAYLVDCFAVDPKAILDAVAGKDLVAHNAYFDLGFLARMGFSPSGAVHDTMTLSRLLYAGERAKHTLKDCAKRELNLDISKDEQESDWSGTLRPEQLAYAAGDVEVLRPLHAALTKKLAEAELGPVAQIEARCLPALVWMSSHGVGVDRQAWQALTDAALADAARLLREMNDLAPTRPGEMFPRWNFDSSQDTLALFQALGFDLTDTADGTLATIDHTIAEKLREYRSARKRTGAYGAGWLKLVADDGRVYPKWNQAGSEAGRMSCSGPNMQQLPRDKAYRRCVVAPPGRVLVKADYSQIELRIAAKVSGDQALLDAYAKGIDVHTQTARRVLGKEDVTKEDRQLAKALNFGLVYGMSADGFRTHAKSDYNLDLTEGQARQYRDAFFQAYPGLARWHADVKRKRVRETRTLAGRRRLIPPAPAGKTAEEKRRYESAMDRQRMNTPVQGTGADGLKLALALLWERRGEVPGAFPVLAVHDEVVVECDAGQVDTAAAWLERAMVEAMAPLIDPVPVGVEARAGPTWAGG